MVFGVADAAGLGLVQVQPTRPKLFAALAPDAVADRVIEIARERTERFAAHAPDLLELLTSLPGRVRGKRAFVDLAFGAESHVKRHLMHLAAARERILSYMERGDLQSIEGAAA